MNLIKQSGENDGKVTRGGRRAHERLLPFEGPNGEPNAPPYQLVSLSSIVESASARTGGKRDQQPVLPFEEPNGEPNASPYQLASLSSIVESTSDRTTVPPGDIATQPGTKIVFNAPYDDKPTYHIKDTKNDYITIEWTNTPEWTNTEDPDEWFQSDGIVRRKNLPIEYNP